MPKPNTDPSDPSPFTLPISPFTLPASPFPWTHVREQAALLVAEDRLNNIQIAAHLRVGVRTVVRWKAHPEFAARVRSLVETMAEAVKEQGIASKQRRLQALDDRWRRLNSLIEERARQMAAVPGGASGLLEKRLRKVKVVVTAQDLDSAQRETVAGHRGKTRRSTVEAAEYVLDVGLLRELRELERQAAIEMGQWNTGDESSYDSYDAQVGHVIDGILGEITRDEPSLAPPLLPSPTANT